MITFTVYGTPQPQGSMRAFTPRGWKRPIITSDNKNLKPWRQEVSGTAMAAMADSNMKMILRPAAVCLEAHFYFARPKSIKKATYKTTKPDGDKICRSLFDALTGICFEDDSQVCVFSITKQYGVTPRVVVEVGAL